MVVNVGQGMLGSFLQDILHVNITSLRQVEKFKDLRTVFSIDGSREVELEARITTQLLGRRRRIICLET